MLIKRILLSMLLACGLGNNAFSQVTGTITVQGDAAKFYPVTFYDGGWDNNVATTLEIGRSYIHKVDGDWWGSVIAKFRFHTTNGGHGSNFIDADIRQKKGVSGLLLIAGWTDVTSLNGDHKIIIWLRGATPYVYKSDYAVNPAVYDGVVNSDTYQETNGYAYTYKTEIDAYNPSGMTYANSAYFNGGEVNYFGGSIGVGTTAPGPYKLAVEGTIGARKIKVTQVTPWADFVFEPDYQLPSLYEVEKYITANKHLPDVPSAAEVEKEGLDVGEMNKILLQKVEEQTLYLIDLKKELEKQQALIDQLMKMVNQPQEIKK
ncbi:hypothetical protein SAMN05518672_102262 [Chitinophaga sp. CF118]|uniref:hypothetical protein n=1 Tax=Chitinophaga sp. CF118 TaxID=1884367 RepID=UPI0008E61BB1|nr:hypothetical protein [Chitinophaga sp. CF118]SFD51646.1 hypothetical protein SAMN05518672_102262 [Chitinophaga sp. CF118]